MRGSEEAVSTPACMVLQIFHLGFPPALTVKLSLKCAQQFGIIWHLRTYNAQGLLQKERKSQKNSTGDGTIPTPLAPLTASIVQNCAKLTGCLLK